jgi:hypothetical protein
MRLYFLHTAEIYDRLIIDYDDSGRVYDGTNGDLQGRLELISLDKMPAKTPPEIPARFKDGLVIQAPMTATAVNLAQQMQPIHPISPKTCPILNQYSAKHGNLYLTALTPCASYANASGVILDHNAKVMNRTA